MANNGLNYHRVQGSSEAPPVGLRPRWVASHERMVEIIEAINRYKEVGWAIPEDWTNELVELTEYLKKSKDTSSDKFYYKG